MTETAPKITKYQPKEIEPKWQKRWLESGIFRAVDNDSKRPKYYILDMFPYPSAAGLHVGHPEGYTATDIIARMKRMQGLNVLHPMGWDAFGLPAENYAITTGVHPRITTRESIKVFKRQIQALGFSYDWDREVDTTDLEYHRWTQWIFLQLYKKNLAYEDAAPINFCPSCKTGLANEEVHLGACERCGTVVEKRNMRQWMLKITAYADRLLEGLENLDWPESTLTQQKNWIGRSEGAQVDFEILEPANAQGQKIRVFTTRPDTLFGATYLVVAPEHPLIERLVAAGKRQEALLYCEQARKKSDIERTEAGKKKTGVFTGSYALNPANGEKVPVWIADYVLLHYGTGAIMAVPAHDHRDWEFAKAYNLPIREVVRPASGSWNFESGAYIEDGVALNSGEFTGLGTAQFKKSITEWLEKRGLGQRSVTYKLRDWVFSRQRYWGEPIPIVHCKGTCAKAVPIPEEHLPIKLPEVDRYEPMETGESPLASMENWVQTKCPQCGGPAQRETNTMPQWAGSCWYYLRFIDPKNSTEPWDIKKERYWMPVDLYLGGSEHAVLHLLYARFWHEVLYDLNLVSTPEPFMKLRHQGMILAYSYQDQRGAYHGYNEIQFSNSGAKLKSTGEPLAQAIEKMSKSKKNVVNPDEVIERYGADAMRLYEMFMGDFELPKPWDMRTVEGVCRFLERVVRVVDRFEIQELSGDPHKQLRHKTIHLVQERIENFKFNTAITALMEYVNALTLEGTAVQDLEVLLKLLAPFAPHLAEECWERLGKPPFISVASWPSYDPILVRGDYVFIPVQVNGKVRDTLQVDVNKIQDKSHVIELASQSAKIKKYIQNAKVKKVVYVAGKILNFVMDGVYE